MRSPLSMMHSPVTDISVLGAIAHNATVVASLRARGAVVVRTPDEVRRGGPAVITEHGHRRSCCG